jgi:pyruvate/2-oxoglutarate dehydrogenase complex dihydrolipoamide acyltransferase (E2) component
MSNELGPHRVVAIPAERRIVLDFLDLSAGKHYMFALLEVDVTVARGFIEEYKARTGERLSFTGYLVFCLAKAVAEDTRVQASRKGSKQLVLFDDVDVGMMIERTVGEAQAPVGYVVRRAQTKSFLEIHREIRAAQAGPAVPTTGMPRWIGWFEALPGPLRSLIVQIIRSAMRHDPTMFASKSGTVGITSVGMFGKGQGGWGIATAVHGLSLIVGSTAWKPAVVDGHIVPREILCLTVTFDHDVVDGAPAARFTRRLVELIESGYGLEDVRAPVAEAVHR